MAETEYNTPHQKVLAYADGYARGERHEHLTHPDLPTHELQDVSLLAHLLGYTPPSATENFDGYQKETRRRASFIIGYTDGHLGKPRKVHCIKCGTWLQKGMAYRTMPEPLCNDCCQEEDTLL